MFVTGINSARDHAVSHSATKSRALETAHGCRQIRPGAAAIRWVRDDASIMNRRMHREEADDAAASDGVAARGVSAHQRDGHLRPSVDIAGSRW